MEIQPRQLLSVPPAEEFARLSTETYVKGPHSSKDSFEDCHADVLDIALEEPIPESHKTFDVTKRIEVSFHGIFLGHAQSIPFFILPKSLHYSAYDENWNKL